MDTDRSGNGAPSVDNAPTRVEDLLETAIMRVLGRYDPRELVDGYGIRIDDRVYSVGDVLPPSRQWWDDDPVVYADANGKENYEYLHGTSTVGSPSIRAAARSDSVA